MTDKLFKTWPENIEERLEKVFEILKKKDFLVERNSGGLTLAQEGYSLSLPLIRHTPAGPTNVKDLFFSLTQGHIVKHDNISIASRLNPDGYTTELASDRQVRRFADQIALEFGIFKIPSDAPVAQIDALAL